MKQKGKIKLPITEDTLFALYLYFAANAVILMSPVRLLIDQADGMLGRFIIMASILAIIVVMVLLSIWHTRT